VTVPSRIGPTRTCITSSRGDSPYFASTQDETRMSAGATHFYPGQESYYYHGLKGEWEMMPFKDLGKCGGDRETMSCCVRHIRRREERLYKYRVQ
jgi:hypothetical protein